MDHIGAICQKKYVWYLVARDKLFFDSAWKKFFNFKTKEI